MSNRRLPLCATVLVVGVLAAACSSGKDTSTEPATTTATSSTTTNAPPSTTAAASTTTASTTSSPERVRNGDPPPEWLGTKLLPLRADEHGVAQPTPPELVERAIWTTDTLAPPATDAFESTISHPVPAGVLARSTWSRECPVSADELAYATVSFIGFDGLAHTGELLTNRAWVDDLVAIFEVLHEQRFPIEEMRITTRADLDAHPTGDGNNTGSFGCRPTVTSNGWSRHAYGLALDINPFHNPFIAGDLVIPELARDFGDRDRHRIGMIEPWIVELFDELGWGWGGDWRNSSDWMHFSLGGH